MPTQTICGIKVPNTPTIAAAQALAKNNMEEWAYNHIMRSWLLGFAIADRIPDLANRDRELHSIAAILHDLGWIEDETLGFTSADKCFEVDGANAARAWIEKQLASTEWDKHRKQILWDAIALHTYPIVGMHKEPEVKATGLGISADFVGPTGIPGGALQDSEWEAVAKGFPRRGFKTGVVEKLCGFCRTKPETTYNTFVSDFGENMVNGYSRVGKRMYDVILNLGDVD